MAQSVEHPTLDVSLGRDLVDVGPSPASVSRLSSEPDWDSPSLSLSLSLSRSSLPHLQVRILSQKKMESHNS